MSQLVKFFELGEPLRVDDEHLNLRDLVSGKYNINTYSKNDILKFFKSEIYTDGKNYQHQINLIPDNFMEQYQFISGSIRHFITPKESNDYIQIPMIYYNIKFDGTKQQYSILKVKFRNEESANNFKLGDMWTDFYSPVEFTAKDFNNRVTSWMMAHPIK